MRIAVFAKKTTFNGSFGGMEVQNKLLCEGLAKKGHEVVVFSPKNDSNSAEKLENGVKYIFLDANYRYFISRLNKDSWFNKSYEAFKKVHAEKKFDIAFSQSSAGFGIIEHKNELGIRVISIAHGSALGEFKTYYINHRSFSDILGILKNSQYALRQFFGRQRQFILHSSKVVAVSTAVKEQLENETFAPDDLIKVIHNGIEPFGSKPSPKEKIDATRPPLSVKRLLYIGQLEPDKGVELFFDILKDVRFKDFELDIIGDGSLLPRFKQESTNNSNVVKAHIFGKLSHDETLDILKKESGSIFVFPTKRVEGLPMVLIEAMFAGLPVVAFDIGGNKDAVQDAETGFLIKFWDKKELINRVLALAEDPVKMDTMSKNATLFANKNFTLENMLNRYISLTEEVLKK